MKFSAPSPGRIVSTLSLAGALLAAPILTASAQSGESSSATARLSQQSHSLQGTRIARAPYSRVGRFSTIGVLTKNADGDEFVMRNTRGMVYPVDTGQVVRGTMPYKLVKGDYVRVYGFVHNGILYAQNVRALGRSYVDASDNVLVPPYKTVVGRAARYTGPLINNADNLQFRMRDRRGRIILVSMRLIPNGRDYNSLLKGQRVSVYGRWFKEDDTSFLEATALRIL